MSTVRIRPAEPDDLPFMQRVETACFTADRRGSLRSLRHSLRSPIQSVWIAQCGAEPAGVMVLHHHRKTLRIYSVAVLRTFRGAGVGGRLVNKAAGLARAAGCEAVTLEADRSRRALTAWYEGFGFRTERVLPGYYAPKRDAVRMRLALKPAEKGGVRGRS